MRRNNRYGFVFEIREYFVRDVFVIEGDSQIASIPLLTNGSGRNERFSSSWPFTQTGVNSPW